MNHDMTDDFPECDQFRNNAVRYGICRGERYSPEKTDRWRIAWGISPFNPDITAEKPTHVRQAARPIMEPVGTILKNLIESLHIPEQEGCACPQIQAAMDTLGIEGCLRERDSLISALRENAGGVSLWSKLKAITPAIVGGLTFKVNPLDPAPGLFDEAIHLATEERVKKKVLSPT